VQIFTNLNGAAIDTPPFMALFALMAELDRPLLLHPALGMDLPDYAGETHSKYELWWTLGWPYETSKAMYRLVFAGVFDRWPNLKICDLRLASFGISATAVGAKNTFILL
jgi:aminocarboxymuconate-semialdehyde decarboxylase